MADYNFKGLMDDTNDDKKPETKQTSSNGYDFTGLMDDTVKVQRKGDKKEAYKIFSPEELVKEGYSPTKAALYATAGQVSSPLYKYGNMLMGGLPNVALDKMGYKAPEADINIATPFGDKNITGVTDAVANIGGFMRGLPLAGGKAVAGRVVAPVAKGAGVLKNIGRGAMAGATEFGIGSAFTFPKEMGNLKNMAMRGLGGATVGAVTGGASGIVNNFTNLLSEKSLLKTGKDIRGGFSKFKTDLTQSFEKALYKNSLKYPNTKVDISNNIERLSRSIGDSRKLKTLLNTSPKLRKAINSKEGLSLKQTQDLINQLKSTVSEGKLAGRNIRPSDTEVLSFIDDLQKAKHTTFPSMKKVDAWYGTMSDYSKAIKNIMQYGKTTNGLKELFKNEEKVKALRTVLPPDLFKIAKQTATAKYLKTEAWRALDYMLRYGIMYSFVRNIGGKLSGSDNGGEMSPQSGG